MGHLLDRMLDRLLHRMGKLQTPYSRKYSLNLLKYPRKKLPRNTVPDKAPSQKQLWGGELIGHLRQTIKDKAKSCEDMVP